ncbi:fumarate hydratase [Candidatus Micrarchaeota archaeon]|nr:fumarate hydratase [Candidatus Micrarchaeota archaeon]
MDRKRIAEAVERMLQKAVNELPPDSVEALREAEKKEKNPVAKEQLKTILKNIGLAKGKKVPMCQDTGTLTFYVKGKEGLKEAREGIEEGVRKATETVPLRPNSVHPITRKTEGNQPIINFEYADSECMEISVIPKGAGCENMSSLVMLSPSDGTKGIVASVLKVIAEKGRNACPPLVVGIGMGGTSEEAMQLAKKTLLVPLNEKNPDALAESLEKELLKKINELEIGTMGLGGSTTAIAVKIALRPTHTASLPVAINLQCWANRKATVRICGERVELL